MKSETFCQIVGPSGDREENILRRGILNMCSSLRYIPPAYLQIQCQGGQLCHDVSSH